MTPPVLRLSEDEHLSQLGCSHASAPHIIVVAQSEGAEQRRRQEIKMNELSETNPKILVNGEQQEQQDDTAAEEQISTSTLDDEHSEDGVTAEKETQAKMQSVFQQVRNQIRSHVGAKAPKSSIMELVQKVKDREMELRQMNGEPEGRNVSSEETLKDESKEKPELQEEELCAIFEKRLEATKKALMDELEVQICQVRKEMQVYTDQALKDLECKTQTRQPHNLQQESKGPDKKQKPSAAPSLATRRGRVLTRTMTTIIPKTCAPVIVGPRAKSETLKGSGARPVLRDPVFSTLGSKLCRKPPLPPACPPLHQSKKPVRARGKPGN